MTSLPRYEDEPGAYVGRHRAPRFARWEFWWQAYDAGDPNPGQPEHYRARHWKPL